MSDSTLEMSHEELIDEYVGKKAAYTTQEGFNIEVTVENVKKHFGRVDCEVTPLHGTGKKMITITKLLFAGHPKTNGQVPAANTSEINW